MLPTVIMKAIRYIPRSKEEEFFFRRQTPLDTRILEMEDRLGFSIEYAPCVDRVKEKYGLEVGANHLELWTSDLRTTDWVKWRADIINDLYRIITFDESH